MASSPITSWQIDGETVADFIFLGSKITADGDCSHEIKRRLLLGRKVMTNNAGNNLLKTNLKNCPALSMRPEKAMITHSSTPAWKMPWTEEPGGLQSMGLQKSWTQLSK